ncbi:MAG: TetR/AcrR family transcriptional regulator [Desulfomonilia bacterium]|nr:TetR/AcrR family transcriptional regulator [Desulfomonilia bacterium]
MKRPKGRHAGSEIRKGEIIHAALEHFSASGVSQTSMADIRRRSRASTGSIYHHFRSKENLAAEVFLEGIRVYQKGILRLLGEETGAREGIHAVVAFHLKWVQEHTTWARYLFQHRYASFMASTEEEITRLNRDFLQHMSAWFERQRRHGSFRDLPLDISVSLILGPCMEYTRQYLSGQAITGVDQAIAEMSDALWRSLCEDPVSVTGHRALSHGGDR